MRRRFAPHQLRHGHAVELLHEVIPRGRDARRARRLPAVLLIALRGALRRRAHQPARLGPAGARPDDSRVRNAASAFGGVMRPPKPTEISKGHWRTHHIAPARRLSCTTRSASRAPYG